MTEPLRLREGTGPARALMAGSRLAVPSASRRRALAFTSAAASMAASGTAVAAAGTSLVKSVVLCVCLGTVGGGALSLAISELVTRVEAPRERLAIESAPKSSRAVRPTAAPATRSPSPEVDEVSSPPTAERALSEAQIGAPPANAAAAPLPSVASRKPEAAPSLFEEQRAIEAARAAVARGDAAAALATLDGYQRTYARGQFGPEALALRIEALSQGGELARARAAWRRSFVAPTHTTHCSCAFKPPCNAETGASTFPTWATPR